MRNDLERYHRVNLPGMHVTFTTFNCDFNNKNKPPETEIAHTHCYYNVTFFNRAGKDTCIVSPPLCQHLTIPVSSRERYSFMFVLTGSKSDRICHVFSKLEESVEIEDSFGGAEHAREIRNLASTVAFGTKELIAAEMRIIMVKLAQALSRVILKQMPNKQALEQERELRLENFFLSAVRDPNCSKLQLADQLGVSERQLTRILQEIYGKNYHELVLESRMRLAKALLEEGENINDVMVSSGYVSRRTFVRAYKQYFGDSIIN